MPQTSNTSNVTAIESRQTIFFSVAFHYFPSVDMAIANTVLFSFISLTLIRAVLVNPFRPIYARIPLACAVLEAIGYGARIHVAEYADLAAFIVQSLFILVIPIALTLVNYIVLGMLMHTAGKQVGCLQPQRVARTFFSSDMVCFMFQSGGAGMLVHANLQSFGNGLIVAGIVVQLCFFTGFCLLTVYAAFSRRFSLYDVPQLRPVFHSLLTTNALLYIRNIFRVWEALDAGGYVGTHEWLFEALESLAILLCLAAYSHWHFGLPRRPADFYCSYIARVAGLWHLEFVFALL